MNKSVFFFLSCCTPLCAEIVDFVANFEIDTLPSKFEKIKSEFQVRHVQAKEYFQEMSPFDPELKKIVCFNPYFIPEFFPISKDLPKQKLVFFNWEPVRYFPYLYDCCNQIYTWDDSLVDNVKFFKFYYPCLKQVRANLPSFEERKLCTLVARNWVPHRVQIVEFFADKHADELEIYGSQPKKMERVEIASALYKGSIDGYHSGEEKFQKIKNYRFAICFENTHSLWGYVTEKIFDCFEAGCIPIYWGSHNASDYIPSDCFIDYRSFHSNEELYQFIRALTKETYETYLDNIRRFLQSDQAQVFSPEAFDKVVYEAITSSPNYTN